MGGITEKVGLRDYFGGEDVKTAWTQHTDPRFSCCQTDRALDTEVTGLVERTQLRLSCPAG